MDFAPNIAGGFNTSFDPSGGRRGRRKHPLHPTFDPLSLGVDLHLWWDTASLQNGDVTSWADRANNQTLIPGGTGNPTFDGTMVNITATAFLFGANAFNFDTPFEVWQVVDQAEAAGSSNSYSFAVGSGISEFSLVYTPDIGGQCSAIIAGQSTFGGDDYHGVHVVRWGVNANAQLGYLDRNTGQPSSISYTVPIEPTAVFVGASGQGANLWKGRVGDLIITRALTGPQANAMWAYLMTKAGL